MRLGLCPIQFFLRMHSGSATRLLRAASRPFTRAGLRRTQCVVRVPKRNRHGTSPCPAGFNLQWLTSRVGLRVRQPPPQRNPFRPLRRDTVRSSPTARVLQFGPSDRERDPVLSVNCRMQGQWLRSPPLSGAIMQKALGVSIHRGRLAYSRLHDMAGRSIGPLFSSTAVLFPAYCQPMGHLARVSVLALLSLIQGCKIVQTVGPGGSIVSDTGNHDCAENHICEKDVPEGKLFRDTFTAVSR